MAPGVWLTTPATPSLPLPPLPVGHFTDVFTPEQQATLKEVFATGVDYFNNPASRSFILSFGLNR